MALATFALWAACFILTYTFPLLNASLGAYGTFWVYSVICLVSFVFILLKLPETKGKSLEDIEKDAICRAIEDSNYNLSLAAKELGISRKTIHNKINRYGLVIEKKINL